MIVLTVTEEMLTTHNHLPGGSSGVELIHKKGGNYHSYAVHRHAAISRHNRDEGDGSTQNILLSGGGYPAGWRELKDGGSA